MNEHTGAVQASLAAKAVTEAATSNAFTPLPLAAVNGHTGAVRAFLAAKAGTVEATNVRSRRYTWSL